jgi:predicted small metal-binding protein
MASQGWTGYFRQKGLRMSAQNHANTKHLACGAIVPDCPFTASAATEEELMQKVAEHAAHEHGVSELTPELAALVKAAIRTT